MNIIFKDTLNSSDHLQLDLLLKTVQKENADTISAPDMVPDLEDILGADGWWFAVSDPDHVSSDLPPTMSITGFMALYQTGEDSWECVPFVHPDFRRKGIFSSILSKACEESQIPGEDSVYFSCGAENELWKNVLEHIGAEHAWDEYMMERELTGNEKIMPEKTLNEETANGIYCRILENASTNGENIAENAAEGSTAWQAVGSRNLLKRNTPDNLTATQSPDQSTNLPAPEVTCLLAPQGNSVYLYSLEVLPELRNKHLGTAFLSALLPQLAEKGFKTIKLQVSSENLPAMALYKKTGFHITQTLSFYEY